jgi:peptidoglycan hydrolase CwlO-like protein
MDTQQMLGVLLHTTEQQSQTTEKLLGVLQGQIEALNAATLAAQKAASTVGQSAATVEQAARNAAPAIQKAAGEAVGVAVRDSLAGASQTASVALETAVRPILGKLSDVVQAAGEAEGKLNAAAASFGWKWAAITSIIGAGAIATVLAVAWGAAWYQRHQIEQLAEQKAQLQADISELQENVAKLEKRGGKIVFNTCGGRLCIEASSNQGEGLTDWRGPWKNEQNGAALVIPRGY